MLQEQIDAKRIIGVSVCTRLREEIEKLGLINEGQSNYPYYHTASFTLVKDPYTGDTNLTGYWYNKNNQRIERIGRLQFNSDGSFYAEYDVIKAHPKKPDWFIDAITVWGRDELIKAEARLLPISETSS